MEISKNKEKTIELIRQYVMNLVILLIFWGGILRTNYNADTLTHMFRDDADVWVRIGDARYVIALFDCILLRIGIRTTDYIRICEGGALIIYAFSMLALQIIFAKWKPQEKVASLGYQVAICMVYLNCLFAEQLMFTEMSIYIAFAYLMATLASLCYVRKSYICAGVCILIAACTYQYAVIFATVILLFYIFLDKGMKLSLRTIKDYFFAGLFCFGSGLLNLLSIKILSFWGLIPAFRKPIGVGDWLTKASDIWRAQINVLSSCYGLLPRLWLPLIMLLLPLLIVTIRLLRKRKWMTIIHMYLLIVVCGAVLNVLPFMNDEYSFPGRMAFSVFLVIGLAYAVAYSVDISEKWKCFVSYFVLLVLLVNMLFIHFILEDKFVSNTLDETYASMVINEIEKYEQGTGNTVTKIAIAYDDDSHLSYDRVNFSAVQINERIISFAPIFLLQYISNRDFEKVYMDDETKSELFTQSDWKEIDLSEQFVCIGDTAYWCIF